MATKGAVTAKKKQPVPEPDVSGRRSLLNSRAPWISLVARLLLGAMWLYYCLPKLTQPTQDIADVRNFQILPSGLVSPFAYGQPYLELSLGLLLIVGFGTRLAALFSAILLLVYIGGIISLGARGLSISCGCGGSGGTVAAGQTRYTLDVLRDVVFLIPVIWLLWKPRSKYSADDVLLIDGPSLTATA
jgi:uncharacterized membrane protein YphA (DoxX/SURF4 family)